MSAAVSRGALRPPPHSIDAEQSVLGGILVDPHAYDLVAPMLSEEDFYRQGHRMLWRALAKTLDTGARPDIVTLGESLVADGNLEEAGGVGYLGELAHNTPSAANIEAYARIVVERRRERQLLAAAQKIPEIVADRNTPFDERLDRAQTAFLEVDAATTRGPRPLNEILRSTMAALERRYESGGAISGLATGFTDLDRKIDGLHGGEFTVVAARPSMGKTAFAMDVALHAAKAGEGGVLFVSLEMPAEQLIDRALSSIGKVPHEQVRTGQIADDGWPRITSTITALNDLRVRIDDDPGVTLSALRARARRTRREMGGLSLVVVDYLQLLTAPKSDSRREAVDALSRGLKLLAKDLGVPFLVLAQLSRAVEQRANKRPILSDLRESGSIEQDADNVIFLYRPSVYGKGQPGAPDFTEVIIGKQRNGPIGSVWLQYQAPYVTFVNSERPEQREFEDDTEVGFGG